MLNHAYLVGDLMLSPLWLAALLYRRDLHRELLTMSLIGGVLSVLFAPPFLHDYWHPIYTLRFTDWPFGGLEDFLNGFFVVGTASVAYEELFGRRFAARRTRGSSYSRFIVPAILVYAALFYLPVYFGWWSLYAAAFSFLVLTAVMLGLRHDLWRDALLSGLIVGIITLVGYSIFLKFYPGAIRFWVRDNLNSHILAGIPSGELLWAFCLGATCGPVYEFFAGRKFTGSNRRR